MDINILAKFKK